MFIESYKNHFKSAWWCWFAGTEMLRHSRASKQFNTSWQKRQNI